MKEIDLLKIYEQERKNLCLFIRNDPIEFVHNYKDREDIEIAGFLCSAFAYGKIKSIKAFLKELFSRMEEGPFKFVIQGNFRKLSGLYYRFHKSQDIVELFTKLRHIYSNFGTFEAFLINFYDGDIRKTLGRIRDELFSDSRLLSFFPDPSGSNPLKRWNLYFRWMIRKDEVDLGIWNFMDKKDLIVPLDTHLFKIGRCLGWTKRKRPDFLAALEITDVLRVFSPSDPLLFDFFLCHRVGIGNKCSGVKNKDCSKGCPLYEV